MGKFYMAFGIEISVASSYVSKLQTVWCISNANFGLCKFCSKM